MGGFQNPDEVHRFLGGIFEKALADESVGPRLAATGMSLRMDYTEPDTTVRVDFGSGEILTGSEADREADAILAMTADTANQYWQGRLSLPLAMARGRITVGGSAAQLLKLAPIAKSLHPRYVAMLHDEGRSDLVVS